ncbi:MAG: nucleotidyltransferase domain-containing protein [Desulfobulbaceae bacterium]|nr:nucleotidyltransferase domain-containing protein [Desulfobulbaceae bacterium]
MIKWRHVPGSWIFTIFPPVVPPGQSSGLSWSGWGWGKMTSVKILEKSRPAISVVDFSLEQIAKFLAEKLAGKNVINAYLIGSVAAGTAQFWSDIDLVIVKETLKSFPERAMEFVDLFDLGVAVDILVYTPEEILRMDRDIILEKRHAVQNPGAVNIYHQQPSPTMRI